MFTYQPEKRIFNRLRKKSRILYMNTKIFIYLRIPLNSDFKYFLFICNIVMYVYNWHKQRAFFSIQIIYIGVTTPCFKGMLMLHVFCHVSMMRKHIFVIHHFIPCLIQQKQDSIWFYIVSISIYITI